MENKNERKKRVIHRLKIAKGHLQKVISMVENDSYCIDVLHQSQAVQKALHETDQVILEHHLHTCVADAIQKGEKDEVIREVVSLFKKKTI